MLLQTVNGRTMFTDGVYKVGKKLVLVVIPAFSTLYFTLGNIWDLPAVEQVVGTCAAIATFLGVCLGLSSVQFDQSGAAHDGRVVVTTDETGKKLFSLELNGDPENLDQKEALSFKVAKE